MVLALTGWVVLVVLAAALGFAWRGGGRELWRTYTGDRLIRGVPWGTLLTVGIVAAFYLLAQWGVAHWDEPLTLPFRTWSYLYPTGLLTAGIAHGSPSHLVGNMAGTVAFGVVAEIAWGHYPPAERDDSTLLASGSAGWLTRPWFRALVVVPAAMLAVAFVTSLFSLGATLGFSGAVFAIAGFAVVTRPVAGVVAVAASSAVRVLFDGITNPIVRATTEAGAPGPPSWAQIAFQAHMLGFVIGVVLAVGFLRYRRRPATERVFFGTLLFGLAQSLWLISWSGGEDEFVLYRGAGVVFVLLLTLGVTVAATGSDRRIFDLSGSQLTGVRLLAALWVGLIGLALAGLMAAGVFLDEYGPGTVVFLAVLLVLLALPALPSLLPSDWLGSPATRRGTALGALVVLAAVLAVPGALFSPIVVDDSSVTGTDEITVGDYTITYGENVSDGRRLLLGFGGNESTFDDTSDGLIVVSERRQMYTVAEDRTALSHGGNVSVQVGGVGSRTTVHANRTGWDVTGNDSAYAVDLLSEGERTRSFESERVWADVRLDDHRIGIEPVSSGFEVRVTRNDSTVGTAALPTDNESVTVGPLAFSLEAGDDGERLVVESDGTRVTVAEKETY